MSFLIRTSKLGSWLFQSDISFADMGQILHTDEVLPLSLFCHLTLLNRTNAAVAFELTSSSTWLSPNTTLHISNVLVLNQGIGFSHSTPCCYLSFLYNNVLLLCFTSIGFEEDQWFGPRLQCLLEIQTTRRVGMLRILVWHHLKLAHVCNACWEYKQLEGLGC